MEPWSMYLPLFPILNSPIVMAEAKPRLVRLTAILTQLQAKRMVTAKEIAEKHKVSIRTIYRDIRTLEQSGIPIVTEEGKGGLVRRTDHKGMVKNMGYGFETSLYRRFRSFRPKGSKYVGCRSGLFGCRKISVTSSE